MLLLKSEFGTVLSLPVLISYSPVPARKTKELNFCFLNKSVVEQFPFSSPATKNLTLFPRVALNVIFALLSFFSFPKSNTLPVKVDSTQSLVLYSPRVSTT